MHTRSRTLAAALALAAPWLAVGCASSGADRAGSASATTAVSASAAPSAAASAAATPSTAATVTATVTASASAKPSKPVPAKSSAPAGGGGGDGETEACVNPWLSVTASTSDGAAGTMVQRFVVKNVSGAACSMNGRPTVVPYGPPAGPAFAPTVTPIPAGFGDLGGAGGTIVLAPGGTAAFFLKWSNVPVGDGPCPKAAGFVFRAPFDPLADADKKVAFAFQPCGGAVQVSQILSAAVTL